MEFQLSVEQGWQRMKLELGRVVAAVSTYRGFLDGEPIQYAVNGLPGGDQGWVANFARENWRFLRITNGVQGEWTGDYRTPEAALRAMEA